MKIIENFKKSKSNIKIFNKVVNMALKSHNSNINIRDGLINIKVDQYHYRFTDYNKELLQYWEDNGSFIINEEE